MDMNSAKARIILANTWKVFAIFTTIITLIVFFFPDIIDYIKTYHLYTRILSIPIILIVVLFVNSRLSIKKRVIISFFDTEIEILFGNIFSGSKCTYDGCNIVSVSETISSSPGKYISENTTHDIFLKNIVGNDVEELKAIMAKCPKTKHSKNTSSPKKYPLGTTFSIKFHGTKYIFVVIVAKDESLKCIPTDFYDFISVLSDLWKTVRIENEGFPVNMTLIGSGRSSVNLPPQRILEMILLSLYYESRKGNVAKKIRILIDKDKVQYIDLNAIYVNWSALTQNSYDV
jgi:hypothetical protein